MNKKQIWEVLECCLLFSEDVSFEEMIEKYKFSSLSVDVGKRLFLFLEDKELK